MATETNDKNKRGKIALWLLIAAIILFTGIYTLRGVLIAPQIISYLEQTIEAELGLKISIGGISGSYFSDIELKNVTTVRHLPGSPLTHLQLNRLKLTYRLWDYLGGLPSFLAGSAVAIEDAQLSFDLSGQMESGADADGLQDVRLPRVLPRVDVRNSSIQIKDQEFETRFDGLYLTARSARPGESRFQLRVAQWSLQHLALRRIGVALEADIFYAGENLTVEKLLIDKRVVVKSARIGLGEIDRQLPFELTLNLADGQFHASGRATPDRLHAQVSGSDIDLGRISELLAAGAPPFAGRLSMQGQLNLSRTDSPVIGGDLKVRILEGSFQDTFFQQLAFRFLADDRYLQLEDLQLTTGADRLNISRASVPVEAVYRAAADSIWRSLVVDWRLEGTDVPSLLRLAGVNLGKIDAPVPSHRLVLNGRMENGRLIVPHGRLDVEDGYILLDAADIALPIGERTLKDSMLTGELSVNLPDAQLLSRIFPLPLTGGAVEANIKASGSLLAPQGDARISGRALTYRHRPLGNLMIRAAADTRRVTIESAVLQRGNDRAVGHGTLTLVEGAFENVDIELSVDDLAPYFSDSHFLPGSEVPRVGGGLNALLKLEGPFSGPTGHLSLQARQVSIDGTAFGNLDLALMISAGRIAVSSAVVENQNDRLQLSGSVHYGRKMLEDIRAQLKISELSRYRTRWIPDSLDVTGAFEGRLHATGDFKQPDARADLRVENFRFKEVKLKKGRLQLTGSGRQISIQSAELSGERHQLKLAGDIRRNADDSEFEITLKELSVSAQSTLLALERAADFRLFRNGRIIFDNVALAGSAGRVSVDGGFDPDGPSDLRIAVSGLSGDGWFDQMVTEQIRFQGLDADFRVFDQAGAPFYAIQGTVDNLGSRDVPMAFSGRFNVVYANRVFNIHEFAWQGTKGQQVELRGTFPLDPLNPEVFPSGPLALNGSARIDDAAVLAVIVPWAQSTGGSIRCDFNLSGTWKRPSGRLQLTVSDLQRPSGIRPLPPGPYNGKGDVRIDGDLVTLESLEASSAGWNLRLQGQWRGALTLAKLAGSAAPKATGRLNLEGSLNVSDLSWVARELDGVRRLTGRLEARGRLQGPITALAGDAVIKLSDAEFASDFDMPSLRGLTLDAAVTPEAVNIRSLIGELGGAAFELTGSWPLSKGSGAGTDLRLRGENLLLYRSESTRLRADTDLTLKGPPDRLELAGEVAVTDGRFSQNFGVLEGFATAGKPDSGQGFQLFSIRKAPWRDMVFNVRITHRSPFVIRNNLVRGSVRPDLVLKGTGEIPLLNGNVYVESTRLYLPAGRMQIENGLVRFDRADPDRPRLDLIGTSTMLGYDITAVVEGPYDEPVVTLSSTPPLPNEDLLMLLLTGQPPKSSTARADATRQGLNVAVFLGRDLITRLSGEDSAETFESILDRFDVEVGRGITRRGEDTIHSQFRLADDILVEGDSLYLTGERDYFDYYNGGIRLVFRFH
jgi:hypothetical protein